ncbi:MAG: T9SS type A sorting domain-containing protein [Bacteroidia bacterium]
MKIHLTILFLFSIFSTASAQTPTVQDCLGAIPIVSSIYYEANAYSGTGNYVHEIDPTLSCLQSGEKNDVWYRFTTVASGTWGFNLTPNNITDDYDWAVFDITGTSCAAIDTNPALQVSCNYSGVPGVTGPNGQPGGQSEPLFQVTAGHTYVINVSQFSSSVNGYTITFINSPLMFLGNYIDGTVYIDNDSDCVQSASDPATRTALVSVDSGAFYIIPDSAGHYSAYVDSGTYTLNVIPRKYYLQTCPVAVPYYTINFPGVGNSSSNDFAVRPAGAINDLAIDLELFGTSGGNTYITLFYHNYGTTVLNGSVHLDYDSILNFSGGTLIPDSIYGKSLVWNFNNLQPGGFGNVMSYFFKTLPDTNPVKFYATINPYLNDTTPADNFDSLIVNYGYPFDPNGKTVEPAGIIDTTQMLTYTIRFQNTGTDTANNVILKDMLDTNLDVSSLNIISFSHSCNYLLNNNQLEFYYYGIYLPDSNVNEPASHGFVKYSIKQKPNLPDGTQIKNYASIFFDANAPIATNTVTDTVAYTSTAIPLLQSSDNMLLIYPNPSDGDFNISLKGYHDFPGRFILTDALGRIIYDKKFEKSDNAAIKAKQIANGIYFTSF